MGCATSCRFGESFRERNFFNIPSTAKRLEELDTIKSRFWSEKEYLWKVHVEKENREISAHCDNNFFISKLKPHPHLCLPQTVDLIDKHMVVRMPLAKTDLFELLKKPFDSNFILGQLKGLADAIAYLHKNGRAHRDIKAENIVQCKDKLCLIDFDYAYPLEDNVRCGTKGYMIPEEMLKSLPENEISKKYDTYAFGKLIFFILWHCGRQKKIKLDTCEFIYSGMYDDYLETTNHPFVDIYGKWADVAVRCIQKNPPSMIPIHEEN